MVFFYIAGVEILFYIVKCIIMKKLLTLVVLVAGVALFAGCLNKPEITVEEATTPTVEEVVIEEAVIEEAVITDEAVVEEVAPEAVAE